MYTRDSLQLENLNWIVKVRERCKAHHVSGPSCVCPRRVGCLADCSQLLLQDIVSSSVKSLQVLLQDIRSSSVKSLQVLLQDIRYLSPVPQRSSGKCPKPPGICPADTQTPEGGFGISLMDPAPQQARVALYLGQQLSHLPAFAAAVSAGASGVAANGHMCVHMCVCVHPSRGIATLFVCLHSPAATSTALESTSAAAAAAPPPIYSTLLSPGGARAEEHVQPCFSRMSTCCRCAYAGPAASYLLGEAAWRGGTGLERRHRLGEAAWRGGTDTATALGRVCARLAPSPAPSPAPSRAPSSGERRL